ncbi:MAG: hypothetical protein ABJ314_13545 [Ilumatobacter sp.]|uniref:hypothetical protein n=1 Tax=Ilumatobacter sp. TaxID=1967498 RepID=UPI0032989839
MGRSLKRYFLLLLPMAVVAVGLGVTVGQRGPDVFQSEVNLVFAPSSDLPETYEKVDALDTLNDRVLQGTYIELTESRTLLVDALAAAQLDARLIDDVEVDGTIALEANIVTVMVHAPSSDSVTALTDALADVTIERFEDLYPIIDVTVVDQPTAPDGAVGVPYLQLVVLALVGAFLLWTILAVLLGRIRS